jgi:hypothetical protein
MLMLHGVGRSRIVHQALISGSACFTLLTGGSPPVFFGLVVPADVPASASACACACAYTRADPRPNGRVNLIYLFNK